MYIVFDLETTGLPDRLKGSATGYYPPHQLDKYDKSRVVQLAYIAVDKDFNELHQNEFKIKGVDLMDSTRFHGITDEILERDGVSFEDIIEECSGDFTICKGFIAHNADFDMNILCSELIRRGYKELASLIYKKPLICSMKRLKNVVGIKNNYGIKYPSLAELYRFCFGQEAVIENAHDAMADTSALVECLKETLITKNINVLM